MNMLKRIFAIIVIILSAAGILICLAGVAGIWVGNTALTNTLTDGLTRVENVMGVVQTGLERVDTEAEQSRATIEQIEQALAQAGDNLAESDSVSALITDLTGVELAPKIRVGSEIVTTMRGTAVSVNSTLEAANSVPMVSVPTLPMERLQELDQRFSEAVETVREINTAVADLKTGSGGQAAAAITDRTTKLDGILENIQTSVNEFGSSLSNTESNVAAVKASVPGWIDWASIIISLVLLWLILAHAGLLYLSLKFYREGKITG
jgi:uncharacterized coiled-coil protein SlyX